MTHGVRHRQAVFRRRWMGRGSAAQRRAGSQGPGGGVAFDTRAALLDGAVLVLLMLGVLAATVLATMACIALVVLWMPVVLT